MRRHRFLAVFLLLLPMASHPAIAGATGPAYLVADTVDGTAPFVFQPRFLAATSDRLYFAGRSLTTGFEPWRTDGTPEGTEIVADLCGGSCPSLDLYSLGAELFEGDLYFPACELGSCALWKTDGVTLVPIFEGIVRDMAVWNGALYFTTALGELRRTDGGGPGTLLHRFDVLTPFVLVPAENAVFVLAVEINFNVVVQPSQLWRTDGTPEGTFLIRESPSLELFPVLFRGQAVFADDNELWVSDSLGAEPLLDDPPFTAPVALHSIDGVLFVIDEFRRLWRTDGTPGGTSLVAETAQFADVRSAVFQGELYFVLGRKSGALYRTVERSGKTLVHDFPEPVSSLRALDGRLYAGVGPPALGHELWTVSGETVSGQEVSRVFSLAPTGSFSDLTSWDGALYFDLTTPESSELGRYTEDDGVVSLTRQRNGLSGDPRAITRHRDAVLFEAGIATWWRSDGTPRGTFRLSGAPDSGRLVGAGDEAFLQSSDEVVTVDDGGEVVRVFEKPRGKVFVDDVIVPIAEGILFLTYFPGFGADLWIADRETGETRPLVERIHVAATSRLASALYERLDGDVLLFLEEELWRTDGTAEGTRKIFDASQTCDCNLLAAVRAGGRVFFLGSEPRAPITPRLWRTDGTAAGTSLVRAFPPDDDGLATSIRDLTAAGDRLFFVTSDRAMGDELWTSDGTAAGTGLVRELRPGAASSDPRWLVAVGDRLFFTANDGVHGRELWTSDGTGEGTRLVTDLLPGPRSANVQHLTAVDARLVFAADDGVHGLELWASDGTAVGTRLLQDVQPGPLGSDPHGFAAAGDLVFFTAGREDVGLELWAVPRDALFEPLAAAFRARPQPAVQAKPLTFADASAGRPDSWCWRFGDEPAGAAGCSAVTPLVRHGYLKPGVYTVTLRVGRVLPSGAEESSEATMDVVVVELCPGCLA